MIDRKQVDLLIRAQFQGKQTLDSVNKSLQEISGNLDKQTAAAKRGESVIDELKASYAALQDAQAKLANTAQLVGAFQTSATKVADLATKVESAKKKLSDFTTSLGDITKASDAQVTKLQKLQVGFENAEKRMASQVATQNRLRAAIEEAGLSVDDLAASELKLRDAAVETGKAMATADAAIKSYATDVRAARDANAALARNQKEAAEAAAAVAAEETRLQKIVAGTTAGLQKQAQAEREAILADHAKVESDRAAAAASAARAKAEIEARAAAREDGNRYVDERNQAQAIARTTTELQKQAQAEREGILADAAAAEALNKRIAKEKELQAAQQQRAAAEAAARAASREDANRYVDERNQADTIARTTAALQAQAQAERQAILADAAAADARAKKDAGLRDTADQAQAAARGYSTLARAATDLTPKVTSLRDAVNAILNPSNAARSSLSGVEAEVLKLGSTINAIKGPVNDYNALFKSLVEAQKSLAGQSSLVDNFKQQIIQLRAARTEFTDARNKVNEYAAAVRAGGASGESFVKALAQAEQRAKAASAALQQQLGTTRAAREELRAAGVATNDLANAEQRLVSATQATVNSTKQLTAAVDQYGEAAKRSKSGGGLFGDEGRTTLSFVQRLRGEVLALAAAYTGLQGAINLAQGSIDAVQSRESSKTIIGVGLGTTEKKAIDDEYDYIKGQADRIGLVLDDTTKQYAKFAVAAAKSGRSRQEIRAIFESFAEGGRVLGLTTDNLNGVFLALEQIFSKGKLGAEELRGQLGERLPGVFEVAQKALAKQFPDLNKAMQEGKVGAEQLVLVADEYRKIVAEQLPGATQSLGAQQARLTTAVEEFKRAVGDAGWTQAYTEAVQRLTEFLKSDDGQKFAKSVSSAFTLLANVLVTVLENFDLIKVAAEAFLIIFAGKQLVAAVTRLNELRSTAKLVAVDFKSAASIASAGLMLFQSALIGWEIGTYLREKFALVRAFGTYLVTDLAKGWAHIKADFQFLMDALPDIAYNGFVAILNQFTFFNRQAAGMFASLARATGQDKIADALEKAIQAVTVAPRNIDAAMAKRKAQLDAELAQIEKIRDEMLEEDFAEPLAETKKVASATAVPPVTGGGKAGPSEADIAKRARKIEEITKALETLDAKIDRSQTQSLSSQLDAIDTQYAALKRKIDKLGGPEEAAFMQQLAKLTGEYKEQIISKFNASLAKEQEAILSKLEAVDAAAGRKSKTALDSRLQAISTSYEATYREIADYRAKLEANNKDTQPADDAKVRLDAGIAELKRLEQIKFASEELKRREADVNQELEARAKLIAAVRAQQEVNAISSEQAAERINQINANAVPAIQAAVEKTVEWANANAQIFNNPEQQAAFIATLNAVALKAAQVKTEFGDIETAFNKGAAGAISNGLGAIVDNLNKVASGQQTVAQGFQNIAQAFGQFAAQFLMEIAQMIIKLLIFTALKNSGIPGLSQVGSAGIASVGVSHGGGMAGRSNRSRNVPSQWFANAPRYHSGGMPGLASDEYATILQRGEEVLTGDDPRNIMNGGAGLGGAQQQAPRGQRVVLVDDRAKIPEAMNSAEGDAVTIQSIKRNLPTIKSLLK